MPFCGFFPLDGATKFTDSHPANFCNYAGEEREKVCTLLCAKLFSWFLRSLVRSPLLSSVRFEIRLSLKCKASSYQHRRSLSLSLLLYGPSRCKIPLKSVNSPVQQCSHGGITGRARDEARENFMHIIEVKEFLPHFVILASDAKERLESLRTDCQQAWKQ
jgi:hypothetical protein